MGFPGALVVQNLPANAEDARGRGSILYLPVGKSPWNRKWQPPPGFLSEKSPTQRSPEGYSPLGITEHTHEERHSLPGNILFCVLWFLYRKLFNINHRGC